MGSDRGGSRRSPRSDAVRLSAPSRFASGFLACILGAGVVSGAAACAASAQARPAQSGESGRTIRFEPDASGATWIGADFYANRLMDWRAAGGRLECVEASARRPMRTAALLTSTVGQGDGEFRLGCTLGPAAEAGANEVTTWLEAGEDAWGGFLIGVGGEGIEWRTSALVHHWPGEAGGFFAGIDGAGRLVLRQNEHLDGPRGPGKEYTTAAWPLLTEPVVCAGPLGEAVELVLRCVSEGEGARLVLEARQPESGESLGRIEHELKDAAVLGSVALVSHRGPFWFGELALAGEKLQYHAERSFGPIVSAMYTLSDDRLKMTAQLVPLGDDRRSVYLELQEPDGTWRAHGVSPVEPGSWTARFRTRFRPGARYRLSYGEDEQSRFEGLLRREPSEEDDLILGALSCHDISSAGRLHWTNDHIWWPHADLVERLAQHDPDMLFFAGDQIYEGGLAGIVREPLEKSTLDYLYHWYRFVWAFRDLMRERPTVCLPDDHDVYHGNIWGNGGVAAEGEGFRYASDRGGYVQEPAFVNVVHATQVAHLPNPVDPAPLENGIGVYFTGFTYGGVSFAVLADRMFKSAPRVVVPEGDCVNGWFQNPDFDPVTQADVPGAKLLGERQLAFLDDWAADWSGGAQMKAVLSQTIFHNVATIPNEATSGSVLPGLEHAESGEYVTTDKIAADCDSNGWPQSGRRRALERFRKAFAYHVAGDQHLPSFTQYGLDDWRDGPFAFCVPAIANLWPRRFFPPQPGLNRSEGAPAYAGDHTDGFGNKMTVLAVANPMRSGVEPSALMDRNPGYGIVRFDKRERTITAECWPRWEDPLAEDAMQFPGWPITVRQEQGSWERMPYALPEITVLKSESLGPVFEVRDASGELVYALRIRGIRWRPPVPAPGSYQVRVGFPDAETWKTLKDLRADSRDAQVPGIAVELVQDWDKASGSLRSPKPLAPQARTEDSPGFLGPRRDGISRETGLALEHGPAGPELAWSVERGQGFAAPVIQADRLVFTHREGDLAHIDCRQAEEGDLLWRFSYPTDYRGEYITDSGPRATPEIAGERVFVHGVEGWLHALDLETGEVLWKRDLTEEYGLGDGFFGVVASPLAWKDRLILNLGAPERGATVVALDQATGKTLWESGEQWGASCASPVLADVHGRERVLVLAGGKSRPPTGGLIVLDPQDGAIDFSYPFRSRTYTSVNGASPVYADGRVFLTAAYNTGTVALTLDADCGYEEAWKLERFGVEFANPLYVDGYLYFVDGIRNRGGDIVCLDPATGEELARTELAWEDTVERNGRETKIAGGIGTGSLLYADGEFLALGEGGDLLRLECTPEGAKILERTSLFRAPESWTPLVLSHGLLYVAQNAPESRGEPRRLLCYDLRSED